MMGLNKRIEEPVVVNDEEQHLESASRIGVWMGRLSYVMSGALLSKESVVRQFPFLLYVAFLLMMYITNIYVAEDMSREMSRYNKLSEERYVEYIYLKSEITDITKQSSLIKMLRNTGIKESVDPFKKIVVRVEGGSDD